MKKLAIAIFTLCLLESLCYFWTGWWAYSTFRSAGATFPQAFAILKDEWITGTLVLLAGILHGVAPRLRIPLAVVGVFSGFYGAFFLIKSPNLRYSWNIIRGGGDPISSGNWSEAILIVLALVCAAELVVLAVTTRGPS